LFATIYLAGFTLAQGATGVDLRHLLQQAHAAEEKGDYSQAERVYRRALTVAPNDLDTLMQLGVLYQKELKFDKSIPSFERILKADPRFPSVNLCEGISYLGQNDYSRAIESFERELDTPRPQPRTHYYLALALRSAGHIDEALAELNRAAQENPRDADVLYQLVRIHKDVAIKEMIQAAQSNPKETEALKRMAWLHADAARHEIEQLKEAAPNSFQWHALMGEVYADQKDYPEALKEYRAALARRPNALGLHYSVGVVLWTQAHFDEAAKEFQQALLENPKDPLTNLYLAGIAVRQQRFDEALSFLATARVGGAQNMPVLHLLLGRCYLAMRNLDKAKAELLATVEANPEDAEAHYLLARVYRESGDAQASAREIELFQKLMKAEKEKMLTDAARPQD
jgi:tetratricopeptide (TPR) repeat protein